MSLQAVFDAIAPVLIAAAGTDGGPAPFVALGEENLQNPGAVPAIVWVPVGGPVVPGRQSGNGTRNPQQLWMRQEQIHVHVFTGSGFRETETLVNQLVATMQYHMTPWGFRVVALKWSHGWPVETDEPRADLSSGTLCVVHCEIQIPLTAEKMVVARPTTKTIDPQTMNPPEGA